MPTVDDLRNDVRVAVDRYERRESTAFTKEALAAVAGAVGSPVEKPLPPKGEMRAAIAESVEGLDADRDRERPFRKAELETLVATVAQ
ncbi:hypothetical protein [Halosegnis rubeus]|jgi:hypothetical protein|uniref:Uncharacterized protein n=1 Tax=Halosegnis rubeus TaxID=2212850 RepID=A0A5N5UL87_9EURY|nr:hypothetical protein [Halosegnis rubeus]KAB7519690.1 hypothetical protein DP108_00085 [Halosegnis rubeus]